MILQSDVMSPDVAASLVSEKLLPLAERDRMRVAEADKALKGNTAFNEGLARAIKDEHKRETQFLKKIAATPLLELVISVVVQQTVAEGVSTGGEHAPQMWKPWEANGLRSRQHALYHAILAYGKSYMMVTPGVIGNEKRAVMVPLSPAQLVTVGTGEDGAEYPAYALRTMPDNTLRLYDANNVYTFHKENTYTDKVKLASVQQHGLGVCPVVTYGDFDIHGNAISEIDRYELVARRFEKSVLDRLMVQQWNSWRVKTATGLDETLTDDERAKIKLHLAHSDILTGSEGVQFGTLPETQMDGLLRAAEADRDMLAAVSQTPVWALNGGQMTNLSAEALAESRSMSRLKVQAFQRLNNRGHCHALRLASHVEGRYEDAANYDLQIIWDDVEARSMSQMADALGKIATQLRVPAEKLWELIPGVSRATVQEWQAYAEAHPDADTMLAQSLTAV